MASAQDTMSSAAAQPPAAAEPAALDGIGEPAPPRDAPRLEPQSSRETRNEGHKGSTDAQPRRKHHIKMHLPFLGQRSQSESEKPETPSSAGNDARRVTFEANRSASLSTNQLGQVSSSNSNPRRPSRAWTERRRASIDPRLRPEEPVYHDSRAATRAEFRRRGTTLQDYYRANPTILPQLPFTFRHGFKRWKLGLLILFMIVDACVIPIILYYALTFGGNVQGWITFAIVTAIWGGPAYVEFAVRSWRLILKERFFRPLGASSRWCFDITNWIFTVSIFATTTFLIVGAAPHIVWLRILALPGPALLLTLGGSLGAITMYSMAGWKAPFRISSTPKGEKVLPGVYYLVEDIVAVNAAGGLPFREGLAARYEASPVFRKMIRDQSLFWSIGSIVMGVVLFILVCIHSVRKEIAYGVGWAVPFIWGAVWAVITVPWVRREMHRETVTWDDVCRNRLEEKADMNGNSEATTPATEPAAVGGAEAANT